MKKKNERGCSLCKNQLDNKKPVRLLYIFKHVLKKIRNKKIMLIYHYNMPIINGELFNNVLSIAMIFQANLTQKMKQVV